MNTMEQVNKLKIENFDKEVLREYDIRGVVGNNINHFLIDEFQDTSHFQWKSKPRQHPIISKKLQS